MGIHRCVSVLGRLLSVRNALLGPAAAPLPVIGPWPLRRVLACINRAEALNYNFIDSRHTLPASSDMAGPPLEAWLPASLCNALLCDALPQAVLVCHLDCRRVAGLST